MTLFKRANSIAGWLCFAIATVTYMLTIEPTESLWDCGEFIATAYKLEVGHPPGNSIYLLIARIFSLFSFGNTSLVAPLINALSALCSAFTILFLFWSITHLSRKLITINGNELSAGQAVTIIGAGIVGALAYTFSDTFWFSAVEAEVYAMSSLCTAITFWAILKWEDRVNEPYANRWIMFIGILMGLSIGIHMLNLLSIPSLALIYYFKKYKGSWKGAINTFLIACGIVLGMMIIIPGIPQIISKVELLFVNGFGLPINSGTATGFFAIMGFLFWACYATHKKGKRLLNTISLFVTLFVIGLSSCGLSIIRSSANPPINENAPDNVFSLIYYLNRSQYGAPPLIYGKTFASTVTEFKEERVWAKKNGRYEKIAQSTVKYNADGNMLFPRMHDRGSFNEYKSWANLKGGEKTRPTFVENMRYLFSYQIGWMYMRYFFWNFAGRQNDIQGHGGPIYGNWVSGIKHFDEARIDGLGDQPGYLKNNKANNKYYFIPLVLGLIGLGYQLSKNSRQWFVVALLFFFTGLAIILYINQTPLQPRERDYAFAGSFYAFAIWIGMAVIALQDFLSKRLKAKSVTSASLAVALCLPAPIIMVEQNWDDHDRSNRYMARDVAYNYLMSCEPNAILFTVGDNDTFPLWYLQEVEGVRTDVRVVCFSLLSADWYIDQMKFKTYKSDPLPVSLPQDSYMGEENMEVLIQEHQQVVDLKRMVDFIANPKNKHTMQNGLSISYFPSNRATIPVDKKAAIESGIVAEKDEGLIVDTIKFSIPGQSLIKSQLVALDIIANNGWKRPIYFTSTGGEGSLGLKEYLQNCGFTYKLTPIKTSSDPYDIKIGRIDSDWLYTYLMHTCRWGNMNDPKIYVDHFYNNTFIRVLDIRGMFANLAQHLADEGKKDKAIAVLDKVMELTPHGNFPYCSGSYLNDMAMVNIASLYYKLGEAEKAGKLANELAVKFNENFLYFYPLFDEPIMELQVTAVCMQELYRMAVANNNQEVKQQVEPVLLSFGLIKKDKES